MSTQLASPVTGVLRPSLARRPAFVATVLGALATVIELAGSWIPSLWGDEAASVLSAERPLATLWTMVQRVDAVHATYYLGLHVWIHVFGASPFSVRFPSAIAVGAAVAAVVLIGFRLESAVLGWTAGLVVAVLPRITYVGAEARSYAFSAAIAAWLTLIFLAARAHPGRRRLWVGYAVLLCVGVYVFLYVALIAVAHGVAVLLGARRRVGLKPWAIATGAAVVGALPLIAYGIGERSQIGFLAHRTEVTPTTVFVTLWFGQPIFALIGWLFVTLGLVVVVVSWWRTRRTGSPSELVVIAAWFLVPTIILIGTSPVISAFTARYLTICTPAVGLLIGVGIAWLGRRWTPAVALAGAVVVVAATPVWIAQRGPNAENQSDWAEISAQVGQLATAGDAIAFDDGVRPSRRPRVAARMYPAGFAGLEDVTLKHPYWATSTWHDTAYTIDQAADRGRFAGVTRVWLVEYATASTVDDYGIADLRDLGFVEGPSVATFRSRIIEFTRTGA